MSNIVHIINALPHIGGAERLLLDVARVRKPFRMRVIVWMSTNISLCEQDVDDVLDVLVMRPVSIKKLRQAKKWINDADLLHVHLFPSLYLAALIPGIKIYTEHNTWNRRRSHRVLQYLERFVYSRYDHVVAISDAAKSSLMDWLLPLSIPITTIDNGVPLDRFHRSRRTSKSRIETKTLGMAGSFSDQKNQDYLVRVLPFLSTTVHLELAGDGPRRLDVEILSRSLGVADRVKFLGNVHDMPGFYSGLDIYIQSSHWEGFGLTVVEAMANGLPCLASDVPGLAEVVGDKSKLFRNDKIGNLVDHIEALINSPVQYQEWVSYSLARAEQYSISKMVAAYDGQYSVTIASHSGANV